MTGATGGRGGDALTTLQQLEAALDDQDDSQARAKKRLEAAGAEAERTLAAARASGNAAADRRRAALHEQARADATAVEAAARVEVARLDKRLRIEQRQLLTRLMRLVLGEEVQTRVGTDDAGTPARSPNGR